MKGVGRMVYGVGCRAWSEDLLLARGRGKVDREEGCLDRRLHRDVPAEMKIVFGKHHLAFVWKLNLKKSVQRADFVLGAALAAKIAGCIGVM